MVAWWSSKPDEKTIFYKLYEHFVTHYKVYKDYEEQINTLVSSQDQWHANETQIHSSAHIAEVLAPADWIRPGIVADTVSNIIELPPAFSGSELQDQSPDADMSAGLSTISHNSMVQRTGDFLYITAMSVQANQSSYNQWSRVLPVQVTTYVPADTLNIHIQSIIFQCHRNPGHV